MTKTPKVAVDPDALRVDAVKAVEKSKQVTPRVPLERGVKTKTERVVGDLTSGPGPTRIDDAVKDYRALGGLSGKHTVDPIKAALMDKIRSQSADVASKLAGERTLATIAKTMTKKPPISIFESGPAVLGTLGGIASGHAGAGAGMGLGVAALMHAMRSPSAWTGLALGTKGVTKVIPPLVKGSTFLVKDRDPLAELLEQLKGR